MSAVGFGWSAVLGVLVLIGAFYPLQADPFPELIRLGVQMVTGWIAIAGAAWVVSGSGFQNAVRSKRILGIPLLVREEDAKTAAEWIAYGFLTSGAFMQIAALAHYVSEALIAVARRHPIS